MSNTGLEYFIQLASTNGLKNEIQNFFSNYTSEITSEIGVSIYTEIFHDEESLSVKYKAVHPSDSTDVSEEFYTDYFIDDLKSALERNRKIFIDYVYTELGDKSVNPFNFLKVKISHLDSLKESFIEIDNVRAKNLIIEEVMKLKFKLAELEIELTQDFPSKLASSTKMIYEFAESFSKKTKYSGDLIAKYLIEYQRIKGTGAERDKTKKEIFQNLKPPSDSTLKNWEERYADFCSLRTE